MRTLSKTIVALGLVALMAGPALAQQGRGGGGGRGYGGGGGLGMLLSNASVQQELKLDATQIEKAKEVSRRRPARSYGQPRIAAGPGGRGAVQEDA